MKDIRYEVYFGLNQKDFGQNLPFDVVKEELKKALIDYKINFSLNYQIGGYIHEDSTYVIEEGIKLTFIGRRSTEEEIELYELLKSAFHQEKILVIKKEVDALFERS